MHAKMCLCVCGGGGMGAIEDESGEGRKVQFKREGYKGSAVESKIKIVLELMLSLCKI
jgi:hypothetical protein